jgi:hypothetical protein
MVWRKRIWRRARRPARARLGLVSGANGRVSKWERFSGCGKGRNRGRHEFGGFCGAETEGSTGRSESESPLMAAGVRVLGTTTGLSSAVRRYRWKRRADVAKVATVEKSELATKLNPALTSRHEAKPVGVDTLAAPGSRREIACATARHKRDANRCCPISARFYPFDDNSRLRAPNT